jgi:methylisocitrate lyase
MARTDALAVEGMGRAVERAVACVEAGADMIFPEAVPELAQYTEFKRAVGVPILANITEFGHTPLFTTPELGAAGVDIVLYCCGAYRAMNRGAETVYRALLEAGHQRGVIGIMQTRAELYDYLDYHDFERKLDELFTASAGEDAEED